MESTEQDPAQTRCREYPPLDPEAHSFRAGACVRIGENYYYGGLLRYDLSPKPAYYTIKDLFEKTWHTDLECTTDSDN